MFVWINPTLHRPDKEQICPGEIVLIVTAKRAVRTATVKAAFGCQHSGDAVVAMVAASVRSAEAAVEVNFFLNPTIQHYSL